MVNSKSRVNEAIGGTRIDQSADVFDIFNL